MKNQTLKFPSLFFLFLFGGISFISSCNQPTPEPHHPDDKEEVPQADPAPSTEATKQFFYAWLSYVANERYDETSDPTKAMDSFYALAHSRITKALVDHTITRLIGKTTSLVWGPVLTVDKEISDDGSSSYIVENLMYCVKTTNGGSVEYSVGIAGTNMISPYDWLDEDFMVSDMVKAVPDGNISKGAHLGLNVLTGMTYKDTTLVDFLDKEIKHNPNAKINVAGHSLGGALTQVFSAYLKHNVAPKPKVEAWAYAGPTAGDNTFADSLATYIDHYHAYNNSLDVVPHLWQADSLAKICSIYKNITFCQQIGENMILNVISKYFKDISGSGNYKIPGNPVSFKVALSKPSESNCKDTILYYIEDVAWYTHFAHQCVEILKKCPDSTKDHYDSFVSLMLYLSEMGEQHVTPYVDYFFDGHGSDFKNAVNKYVSSPSKDRDYNADEGLLIAEKFLQSVLDHFPGSISNCDCP